MLKIKRCGWKTTTRKNSWDLQSFLNYKAEY